jgi:hypothetical protein
MAEGLLPVNGPVVAQRVDHRGADPAALGDSQAQIARPSSECHAVCPDGGRPLGTPPTLRPAFRLGDGGGAGNGVS